MLWILKINESAVFLISLSLSLSVHPSLAARAKNNRVPLGAQPMNGNNNNGTNNGTTVIKSALKSTSSILMRPPPVVAIENFTAPEQQQQQQQQQTRRVSFQSGRPPVVGNGARLAQLRAAKKAAQKAGVKLAGGTFWGGGNTRGGNNDSMTMSMQNRGGQAAGAFRSNHHPSSRMERLRKRKGTGREVKPRPFVLVVQAPEILRRAASGGRELPPGPSSSAKRRTAMVVEELDGGSNSYYGSRRDREGEHSAAGSRDGDRAGSFAENEGTFAGYDFNGNRTSQPMFRPKSPHAKQQRKVSMEMNSQLRLLREQHMKEGGVLAEAMEEERLKKEQMELEKRREMLRKSMGGGEVTNTPMAAEALVNMFNIPGRDVPQDSPDWQGVSHMANGQSQPQVQPVMMNENLNNDDDEFGGGFDGGDDFDDQEEDVGGGQFADDRAFDEEGFPIRKPRGEAHKRLREEMARRKSLAFGGLQTIVVEDLSGGQQKVRKSSRQRQRPLEYWRGEKKVYERVHGSLPTIKATQRQTRNKMWPRKTPGGPSETFRVLKLRPTEQFNKIGAERRDSLDQLMTARNGAPLHDSDDEEEIWDVDAVEFDQHGRRIKTFAKTPKEYYGRNGRATPNYNVNNNKNVNNGSGKKKRGRPRKNPIDDGQQQQEDQHDQQVRGKHIRLAPDTDDEEDDERDAELEENTRRNSEAINDDDKGKDEELDEEDAEAEKEANEAARLAELELEEEREEEARKASKAREELMEAQREMEAKIASEKIVEEDEEEEEEDEETKALKKQLADAEAEHAALAALDAANNAARKILDRHDEQDGGRGEFEHSLEEVELNGNVKEELKETTSRFSMSLEANKGMYYDAEADKELIENDPAIKSGSIDLEDLNGEDEEDADDDENGPAKRDSLSSKSEEEADRENDALAIPMDLDE